MKAKNLSWMPMDFTTGTKNNFDLYLCSKRFPSSHHQIHYDDMYVNKPRIIYELPSNQTQMQITDVIVLTRIYTFYNIFSHLKNLHESKYIDCFSESKVMVHQQDHQKLRSYKAQLQKLIQNR